MMKPYIDAMVTDLQQWAQCPYGPHEKEDYKEGEYFFLACGVLVSTEDQKATMVSFHTLIGIILSDGKNNIGLNGDQEVGLVLMANKVLDENTSEGVMIKGGKIAKIKGPHFIKEWQEELSSDYWFPVEGEIPATTLTHVISVISHSEDVYDTLISVVENFFLTLTDDSKYVNGVMEKIKGIKDNVVDFLERDLH